MCTNIAQVYTYESDRLLNHSITTFIRSIIKKLKNNNIKLILKFLLFRRLNLLANFSKLDGKKHS